MGRIDDTEHMSYEFLKSMKATHPAWKLLTAKYAPLAISFFYIVFVAGNKREIPEYVLLARLSQYMDALDFSEEELSRPNELLTQWADDNHGWLRRFYPNDSDDIHYDLTSTAQKAIGWIIGLKSESFIPFAGELIEIKESEIDWEGAVERLMQSFAMSFMYDIDYNEGRYIRLNCNENIDSEIKEFKAMLKLCTEGIISGLDGDEISEQKFAEVKKILVRFQGREKESEADRRWTKKVTDVRNWFLFSASERFRETNEEYAFYADSGGKSGGQKEKLAYTILAASLVYNYGLNEERMVKTSFRVVAIDEAFLKSSDESAKFGLELFKTLDFQLVIVTPLLKIATIEPFISHVGFVSHNDMTHKSTIMNITIDEYREKRREWKEHHGVNMDRP